MDVIYDLLNHRLGLPAINAALCLLIFYIARQRYLDITQDIKDYAKRFERVEKTLIKYGLKLYVEGQ